MSHCHPRSRTLPRRATAAASLAVALFLSACGGGSSSSGTALFAGTCVEPLYKCFTTTGSGTCSYDRRIMQASLLFPNGAKITSINAGAADNQCFGPAGPPVCFSVTRVGATSVTVRGKNPTTQEQITATIVDDNSGMLQIQCPNQDTQTVAKPASNPSIEDLRRCVTQ